ncbi:uncharacterized protein F5Z01DRAFT_653374 [Emericellopsis atlantica]|uniref:Uncharacterized protein n=1 Tax=Emericellopsis atlantica TaxID=2614577 RepID=A0A9P7ZMN5_9HYPO|nr:uncharacterized protein F5Z01DRAFT_653374 [Emericellopsis atlantica]KAG9254929.1 hypothetical protein F5Z01DRAFT_653374 [Emericellopsis atlantica]
MPALPRRHDHCVGWHCLTDAQKFGIIFTCVVVTVGIIVLCLFYMGHAASSRKARNLIRLPGGRQARRRPGLPSDIALAPLPVAHYWPGYGHQVTYQSAIYQQGPHQLRAYPYTIGGPCRLPYPGVTMPWTARLVTDDQHQAEPPCVPYVQPPNSYQPYPMFEMPHHGPPGHPHASAHHSQNQTRDQHVRRSQSSQVRRPSNNDTNDYHHSSWRQRFLHLLRLPVGRASTIASSTTARRTTLRSSSSSSENDGHQRRQNASWQRTSNPRRGSADRPAASAHVTSGGRGDPETDSADTGVATVHSDDYDPPGRQFPSPPHRPSERETEAKIKEHRSETRTVSPIGSDGESNESRAASPTILSVSSVSPARPSGYTQDAYSFQPGQNRRGKAETLNSERHPRGNIEREAVRRAMAQR